MGAESISRMPVLRLTPRAHVVGSGRSLEGKLLGLRRGGRRHEQI